jgi:phospholipid transport system substrate-binding protein
MEDWWLKRRPARWLALGFFALAAVALASTSSRAASGPQDTIKSFYAVLLNGMKGGAAFHDKGRFDALLPEIQHDFDLPYMSRMAVGAGWPKLSPAQKEAVTGAFARYITATYADNFDSYSGERFEVIGQQSTAYGTIVETRLIQSDGKPVAMNYLMRWAGGTWRVGDIYLTGTISQLANLRSQFSSVLAREGPDGLTGLLDRKTEVLLVDNSP